MKNLDAFKAHGDIIWNIANLLRGPYPCEREATGASGSMQKMGQGTLKNLASAATNGKIDVPGWQTKEATN